MSVAEAVVTTDPEGRVTLMNGVAESLTGWRLDDARGRSCEDVVQLTEDPWPASSRLASLPTAERAEPTRAAPSPESGGATPRLGPHLLGARRRGKRLVRRDGATAAIDASAAPIRDAHGEVVGQVVVFRD